MKYYIILDFHLADLALPRGNSARSRNSLFSKKWFTLKYLALGMNET